MTTFIVYAILGLGAGVAYASLAFGVVALYKGSGVLNFAHGGIAMLAAFVYADLTGEAGMSRYVALVIVLVGSALFGSVFYLLVMRPLRFAPVLAKVIATLGLLSALVGFAVIEWGAVFSPVVPSLFPTSNVSIGGGAFVGVDRLYGLGLAIVLAAGLSWLYARTRFGLITRAAAENEGAAALVGVSPNMVAAMNWALGCALAGLAGVIIAPISGLDTGILPLMILPAFAAALLGRFRSFGITAVVAIGIGIAQSELLNYWSSQPGMQVAVPLLVVFAAMVVSGRLIPQRGSVSEGRPPKAPSGRIHPLPFGVFIAGAIVLLMFGTAAYQSAIGTSVAFAIMALSLVVITGYTGQISLAQLTFAGLSGLFLSKLAIHLGVPFPLSILCAALLAIPAGVLVGLPALRVRGINLAVVTYGLAYAVSAVVFENSGLTGSASLPDSAPVPSPSIGGFSFDGIDHPQRFGLFALAVLVLMILLVSNVRRGSLGRKMLAVRSNERAAASAGIHVSRLKLQAFALSSFIAGVGGALLAQQINEANFAQVTASSSVTLLTVAYIGGIASIAGATVAGLNVAGGVMYLLMNHIPGYGEYYLPVSGVLLIAVIIFQPDGIVPAFLENAPIVEAFRRRETKRRAKRDAESPELVEVG
jgi:branched-chain amino acid transport system permease protein